MQRHLATIHATRIKIAANNGHPKATAGKKVTEPIDERQFPQFVSRLAIAMSLQQHLQAIRRPPQAVHQYNPCADVIPIQGIAQTTSHLHTLHSLQASTSATHQLQAVNRNAKESQMQLSASGF